MARFESKLQRLFSKFRQRLRLHQAACQASLSFTISQNLFKLMSVESVMPSIFVPGESPWTEKPGGLQSMWPQSQLVGSRGREASKYLLSSSICGPAINRRNSAGISARSKCLLPSAASTHGPRQKPAAVGRLLSWQQGWRK